MIVGIIMVYVHKYNASIILASPLYNNLLKGATTPEADPLIRPQKFRFRSGSSFAPHFCAPTGVSGKWGIRKWIPDQAKSLRLALAPRLELEAAF